MPPDISQSLRNDSFQDAQDLTNGFRPIRIVPIATVEDDAISSGGRAFEIEEHAVDDGRTLKVGVIVCGISGITVGALLPSKVPGIQLKIFDKNSDVV